MAAPVLRVERAAWRAGRRVAGERVIPEETAVAFAKEWRESELAGLDEGTRTVIDRHLASVPIWREIVGRRR